MYNTVEFNCNIRSFVMVAIVVALMCVPVFGSAQNVFDDVRPDHWSYSAVDRLQKSGVLKGYPNGYFSSTRTLTRYEFSFALKRVLGDWSVTSPMGDLSLSRNDLESLLKLTTEFRDGLNELGVSADKIQSNISDALGQPPNRLSQPVVKPVSRDSGSARVNTSVSLTSTGLITGSKSGLTLSDTIFNGSNKPSLFVNLPMFGSKDSDVRIGEVGTNFNSLVLSGNGSPFTSGGISGANNMLGGVELNQRFGPLRVTGFHGTTWRQDTNFANLGNSNPGTFSGPLFSGGLNSQNGLLSSNLEDVNGVQANLGGNSGPINVGISAISGTINPVQTSQGAPNSLYVFGADGTVRIANSLTLTGNYARSITGNARTGPMNSVDSTAFDTGINFQNGGLHVRAGYRYIDPLFYSPGYWGRIGAWLNPTNVQGPTLNANINLGAGVGVNLGGDFLSGARDMI
ncbi:MAG: S-layer homology domain-containing protein, partial [Chthonomonadales bacterium]